MGQIFAFMTATMVDTNGNDVDGWIDPGCSMTEFCEARNYVAPVVSCDVRDNDLADYVRDALESLGAYADNGDGTFYGEDSRQDDAGNDWTYALHFVHKYQGNDGPLDWRESDWHPTTDGHITLTKV
jgi:hypothetical protein